MPNRELEYQPLRRITSSILIFEEFARERERTFSDAKDFEVIEFDDDGEGREDSLTECWSSVEVGSNLLIPHSRLIREIRFRCLSHCVSEM